MILTDTKKYQAKIVIGLNSVAGVSVTSFQDGLFSLHLSEVSGPLTGERGGHLETGAGWSCWEQTFHTEPLMSLRLLLRKQTNKK